MYRANADGTAGTNLTSTNFSVPYYWHETNGNGVVSTLEYDGPTRTYTNGSGGPEKILVYIEKLTTVSVSIDEGARTEFEFTATKANGAERSLCPTTDPFDVGVPIVGDFVSQTFRTTLVSANHPVEPEYPACIVNIDSVDEPTVCMQSESARDSYLVQVTGGGFLVWLGTHWDHSGLDSPSIAVVGTACGVDLDLAGTAWHNIVSLTAAGCPAVEHSTLYLGGEPPVGLAGTIELIVGSDKQSVPNIGNSVVGLGYLVEDPTPPPPPPPPPVDPCGGMPLVECYAPKLYFHNDEQYFPMDPSDFVNGSRLMWAADVLCFNRQIAEVASAIRIAGLYEAQERNGFCRGSGRTYNSGEFTRPFAAEPGNELVHRATRTGDPGADPLDVNEGFYLDWIGDKGPTGTVLADSVSAPIFASIRTSADSQDVPVGERWIVYQFFYGYDPKSPNLVDNVVEHEGDWERIDVVLDQNDAPIRVRYHGHSCKPQELPWAGAGAVTLVNGTHPEAFVSLGSHASYGSVPLNKDDIGTRCPFPQGKTDTAERGVTTWESWDDVSAPTGRCWYGFGGAWGKTGNEPFQSDATGPVGPPYKITGSPIDVGEPDCRAKVSGGNIAKSQVSWGEAIEVELQGEPGTKLFVFLRSVPTPLGRVEIPASGTLVMALDLLAPIPPGIHSVVVADEETGEEYYISEINVTVPASCDSVLTDGGDGDGDGLLDSCDSNDLDGPAADADFDLVSNYEDNCVLVPNTDQQATGNRPSGTACDPREGFNQVPTIISPEEYVYGPATADDQAAVEAGTTSRFDVLDNDTDPEDDLDELSLYIESGAKLGVVVLVDVDGGLVVDYTSGDVGGTDVIVYVVCDETDRCARGSLTITVFAASQCTIVGSNGDDEIVGTDGDDVICAKGGDDVIDGRGGDDIIFGGPGIDTIFGGAGDDRLFGGRGGDTIRGQEGSDRIRGGPGNDVLYGGAGDDIVLAGRGVDVVNGGSGNDVIRGHRGADALSGNAGDDMVFGGRGRDVLEGNAGDDVLYGRRGNDTIRGGSGSDAIFGGRGHDHCRAESVRGCE